MRISHKDKLIFLSTPKSGSHTGFKLMEDNFDAIPYGAYHHNVIPNEYKHYRSFTFVRNPYERFCALYHACVVNDSKKFVPPKARKSHLEYAKWYVSLIRKNNFPRFDLCAPQWMWLRNANLTHYLHIEDQPEEFNNIFNTNVKDFPHVLKRKHPTWDDVKNEELAYWVNIWASLDFGHYGYKEEFINETDYS